MIYSTYKTSQGINLFPNREISGYIIFETKLYMLVNYDIYDTSKILEM